MRRKGSIGRAQLEILRYVQDHHPVTVRQVAEHLAETRGLTRTTALNVAYLIPNGNIRMEVMGLDPRPAGDDEIKAMQALVRRGMDEGAVGLSIPSLLQASVK